MVEVSSPLGNLRYVYSLSTGANLQRERSQMNEDLRGELLFGIPVCVLGDYNAIFDPVDASNEVGIKNFMVEFGDWIHSNELVEHPYAGPEFTWHNNSAATPIARKLDRCFVNASWLSHFVDSHVILMEPEM